MRNDIKYRMCNVYTSFHPLGITFNEEGVCSGCQVHEKNYLDWSSRLDKLKIIRQYKSKSLYCIVQ